MKKVHIILYMILVLIAIKLISATCINEYFIQNYHNGRYNVSSVKTLLVMNIVQPYIAHYNYGNVLYKNNDFDGAISEYKKALVRFPPAERECSIRINLALAMLQKIDKNQKSEIQKILKEAKQVLCEKGCAHEYDDQGHSRTAEQLKKDIDKMEEQLENESGESDENKKNNDEEQEENKSNEKDIEEQLKEIRKQTRVERQEETEDAKTYGNYNFYSGKKW